MSVEKKMRILLREEDSFYEALVAHTWLSDYFDPGSKLNFIYDEK